MSEDTTTTGLAANRPVDEDVVQEQAPAQDATDDRGVHDRLAPPTIDSDNAIYSDAQIVSAETKNARRILFRVPRTAVLDLENSYLAFQVNVKLPEEQTGQFWWQSFPALVGGAGVIDHIIVRVGQQEVQRIDDYGHWTALHYPELTMNKQQFVRSHLDLSGTAYSADAFGQMTLASNPFAMEDGQHAPIGRVTGSYSPGSTTSRMHKLEYVYQPFGRSVQSHVTIPMMALCPSLFKAIGSYPAMSAEQLSIELVLNDVPGSIMSIGATQSENNPATVSNPGELALKQAAVEYDVIPGYEIEDPVLMCEFMSMPKPFLDAINAQVERGLTRYAYTRYIKKQLYIPAQDDSNSKDAPIRADNSILTEMIFERRKTSGSKSGDTRLGAYEVVPAFKQLNLNINNNNYFEKDLYDGIDTQLQTSRLMDDYFLPAVVYDAHTHKLTASAVSAGKNGRWMGLFSPVGIDFLLESNISRQPILVRHKARAVPTHMAGSAFSDNVDVWLGRAESLILSSTRSRVL